MGLEFGIIELLLGFEIGLGLEFDGGMKMVNWRGFVGIGGNEENSSGVWFEEEGSIFLSLSRCCLWNVGQ